MLKSLYLKLKQRKIKMKNLVELEKKVENILDERNKIKIKIDDEKKLFDDTVAKLKEAHNEKIKKLTDDKNKKMKAHETRINNLEKEKTFLIGTLSIAKVNGELENADFDRIMQKIR